ncbi:Zinc knuckle family protein [Trichomonas vaginalis G3]|uniref:Zinc knuckle family protein n=1 Tax=Trichomonas vaginalis (strain ATCC PRA-98 / G3) TaxID=412133 RepID=A2DEG4_TRIV3|nr:hypothetical protein TVAGG3_0028700 [Trichomonas vaginalis G3]EAY21091.1 Zinc knuckle family protein [Trichomonas vaginalis G3]KAI5539981.1 hypothetical protein TVAGG3_0028700 [Trichomonas vaginalis G3]|eukprot:XP_001582077.1 Zinc knuckle family protein [Trichomonas vaginalis G3]
MNTKKSKWGVKITEEEEPKPQNPVNKSLICMRCGMIGHATIDCHQILPSVEDLRAEMNLRMQNAVKNAPKEWKEDEFGLYLPAEPRIVEIKETWKDGKFCFNCAAFGHDVDNCPNPPFKTVYDLFQPYLKDTSPKGVSEKQKIIDAIHKFNKNTQSENMNLSE